MNFSKQSTPPWQTGARLKAAQPTELSERLTGLDALRGYALYGVLLANAFVSARPLESALQPPTSDVGNEGAGGWVGLSETFAWAIFDGLVVTKFVTLFSLLFGMGLVLQNQRAEAKGLPFARIYRRRLCILALIGIAHGCLLFEGDVLFVYSIVGAFLFLFRKQSAKTLCGLALIPFLIGLILSFVWAWFDLESLLAELERSTSGEQGTARPETLGQLLAIRPFEYFGWLVISSFLSFNWRIVTFFFVGAAIMKNGWIKPSHVNFQCKVGLIGLALGIAVEAIGMFANLSIPAELSSGQSTTGKRMLITFCDEIGSAILSFGYAGTVLWFVHSGRLGWLQRGLAAVGRTALTNYLLQSVAMNVAFAAFLMGRFDKWSRMEVLLWFSVVFAIQMVISLLWLRLFSIGPVEWMWRYLTYRRI